MSREPANPVAPYALFIAAAVMMLTAGSFFQITLPIQWGLMVTEVVCVFGIAYVFRQLHREEPIFPGLKNIGISAWDLGLVLVTSIVLGLFANVVAGLVVEFFPSLAARQALYEESIRRLLRPESRILAVAGIASITIFAPVCEEYLFRGTILPAQRRTEPAAKAIVLNGLLFGAIHFNEIAFLSLSIVGAYFAHVAWSTRTLWPAILAHATLNAVNGVALPYVAEAYADGAEDPTLVELLIAALVLGAAVALLWRASIKRLVRHVPG